MTREIIEMEDKYPFYLNTFWMGDKEGVQLTIPQDKPYIQMTRDKAIKVFELIVKKLKEQEKEDKINPPFWQEFFEKVKK